MAAQLVADKTGIFPRTEPVLQLQNSEAEETFRGVPGNDQASGDLSLRLLVQAFFCPLALSSRALSHCR